jgi:rRNA maturation endonuclease Nob1
MEEEYWTECDACMTETQVMVMDQEEVPQFCPMCGSPCEYNILEDE